MTWIKELFSKNSWLWVAAGSIILWIMMGIVSQNFSITAFISNALASSFIAFAALGQMLVVTTGRGAIDLSIPGVVTLSAYLSMGVISAQNIMLPVAIVILIALGIVVGLINSLGIIYLKIPSIIMTMAVNYILVTATLIYNRGFKEFDICSILSTFINYKLFGVIPLILILLAIVSVFIYFLLNKTTYGKSLCAMGQNYEAAKFAGVKVKKVEVFTYVFSAVLAAMTGLLLTARTGGAFLSMGERYLMETIAAVVIGGTLVSGGKANVVGTLIGCLFLGLIVTTMQLAGFTVGYQNISKGLIIIIVLTLSIVDASKQKKLKRATSQVFPKGG